MADGIAPEPKRSLSELELFNHCSWTTAELLRQLSSGRPELELLVETAILGRACRILFLQWSPQICLLSEGGIVTFHPWLSDQTAFLSFATAHECGVHAIGCCYVGLFKEEPDFEELAARRDPPIDVRGYIREYVSSRHDILTSRLQVLQTDFDHPAWCKLAAQIDVERIRLVASGQLEKSTGNDLATPDHVAKNPNQGRSGKPDKLAVLRSILRNHHFTNQDEWSNAEPMEFNAIVRLMCKIPGWSDSSLSRVFDELFSGYKNYKDFATNRATLTKYLADPLPTLPMTDGNKSVSDYSLK